MASNTSNQNVQTNYSNANAANSDSKSVTPQSVESRGEYTDAELARNRDSVARRAESEWLARVSQPPDASNGETAYSNGRSNKVRLVSTAVAPSSNGQANTGVEQVEFNLSPEISESKQVIYAEIGDIRQAASILVYSGSPSRKWSVNAKFLSRTSAEADATWRSIQLIKSWTNPDSNYKYGIDSATPHILKLYGYGRTWQGIPVVLTGLNIDYPTDIDYIPAAAAVGGQTYEYGTLVPVIQSVSFQLTEARTPDDLLVRFNLEKFKLGVLDEW